MSIHEMTESMKAEFLAAFRSQFHFGEMTATANDQADAMLKAAAWAWQASRAALVIELPQEDGMDGHLWAPDVVAAIEAAGVKVKP
jgi:hypothetical protein